MEREKLLTDHLSLSMSRGSRVFIWKKNHRVDRDTVKEYFKELLQFSRNHDYERSPRTVGTVTFFTFSTRYRGKEDPKNGIPVRTRVLFSLVSLGTLVDRVSCTLNIANLMVKLRKRRSSRTTNRILFLRTF